MQTMATPQLITAEEFMALPLEGPEQFELVRGEVRRMSTPGSRHGAICVEIASVLHAHAKPLDLGATFTQSGFKIRTDPDTVRAPDVGFVRRDRLPDGIPAQALELAPDLVVEVVSPSDKFASVQEKIAEWLVAGVRVALLVDPTSETVTVHRSPTDVEVLHRGDVFSGTDVVPGWQLDIGQVFEATR